MAIYVDVAYTGNIDPSPLSLLSNTTQQHINNSEFVFILKWYCV